MKFPQCAVAFAILRKSDGDIQSFAAFRNTKLRDGKHRLQVFYEVAADAPSDDPLARMRNLIPQDALVIGEVRESQALSDKGQLTSMALPMIAEDELESLDTFVFEGHEEGMAKLGDVLGIPLADPDVPHEKQAHRLASRVMLLWLTYMVTQLNRRGLIEALTAFAPYLKGGVPS
jgi:hypothetical protein